MIQWKTVSTYDDGTPVAMPWQELHTEHFRITLIPRMAYCDRGNFYALVDVIAPGEQTYIDGQDGWPRYYFDEARAKAELEAWLRKRGEKL